MKSVVIGVAATLGLAMLGQALGDKKKSTATEVGQVQAKASAEPVAEASVVAKAPAVAQSQVDDWTTTLEYVGQAIRAKDYAKAGQLCERVQRELKPINVTSHAALPGLKEQAGTTCTAVSERNSAEGLLRSAKENLKTADEWRRDGSHGRAVDDYGIALQALDQYLVLAGRHKLPTKEAKKLRGKATKSLDNSQRFADARWMYLADETAMGKKMQYALVKSTNTINLDFPYQGEQHATLTLRKTGSRKEVIFSIKKGQFSCGVFSCTAMVRVDDKKPFRVRATGPADHSSTMLFLSPASKIWKAAEKAKTITVAATIYQAGAPAFEFPTAGYDKGQIK